MNKQVKKFPPWNLSPLFTSILQSDQSLYICNIFLWQTNAIKDFYEDHEAEDQSGVNRLIWVTKNGMPALVLAFIIVYWVIGYLKYQMG